MADLKDIRGRALLRTGTWNASTGEEVITDADLHAIVAASRSGALDNPVIKLGHTSERNNFSDGEPAYGRVANLRVADGVLYGDFLGMPALLADNLNSAYPMVSVELARNVKLRDQEGTVAHAFDVILTAAALLGETPPAVKGLSQKVYAFREAHGEDAFDYAPAIDVSVDSIAEFAAKKRSTAKAAAEPASAPGEPTAEPAAEPAPEPAAEPAEAPAEEPAAAPAQDPAPEVEQVEAEKSGDTPEISPETAEIAESSPETDAPQAPPAPRTAPNGVRTMANIEDQTALLRKKYGLPESATYKDVLQAVLQDDIVAGVQQNDKLSVRPGTDESPDVPEQNEQIADETERRQKYNLSEDEEATEKVEAPKVELDNLYVSRSAFSELMSDYEQTKAKLAAREAAEVKARRDSLVRSWFSQGLIHKTERATVREELDKSEETVVALLSARTAIYPVQESGHGVADEAHFAEATDETKAAKIAELDDAIFG